MQHTRLTRRRGGHPLLDALRHESWSADRLTTLLVQVRVAYSHLMGIEARHRDAWRQDLPISHIVSPFAADLLIAVDDCLGALGGSGSRPATAATDQLCRTWADLAGHDPLAAFAVVAIGGYWLEPLWRSAVREALWSQPGLYNGDSRFCWTPGGPEGPARRQLWHGIMALGPMAGRTARLARAARLGWYDALMSDCAPHRGVATGTASALRV